MFLPRKLMRLLKYGVLLIATVSFIAITLTLFGFSIRFPFIIFSTRGPIGLHAIVHSTLKNHYENVKDSLLINKIREAADADAPNRQTALPINQTSVQYRNQTEPNYNVHIFYYPWYGNPENDGKYFHWNHQFLPHWNPTEDKKWPKGRHNPPDDIGSNFYPALGTYSSTNQDVLKNHMEQIQTSGAGVLAVSWYPPGLADEQGKPWDHLMESILNAADKHKLKVCFHLEPYRGRSPVGLRKNLEYIIATYGEHPALYKHQLGKRKLPLFYVYDSYLSKSEEWGRLLRPDGAITVRHSPLDGVFIGLLVEEKHKWEVINGGFDGYYTYFASNGFSFGSSLKNWPHLAEYAAANEVLFIPSVGPGYIDERVRPWNRKNTRNRENGKYYETSLRAAVNVQPPIISITSFNEWHEGSQIEKAVPKKWKKFEYLNYNPNKSDYYLMLTRKWAHALAFKKN